MTNIHFRRSRAPWRLSLCVAAGVLLLAASAGAADADPRIAQAREVARRAQQALQQAEQDKSDLQKEKTVLQGKVEDESKGKLRAEAGQRATAASLAAEKAARERLQGELDAEKAALAQLEAQRAELQTQLQATQQQLADQRRVTANVAALLQRSVQALAKAEVANNRLLVMGRKAVDAYATRTPEAIRARDEPFLGLEAVRLDEEADAMRRAMDEALRGTPPAAAPPASP
jgi:chromosome segregation ATPase